MKDILQDVVAHTHQLGFLSLVKVTNEEKTKIESMAEDRSVILSATTNNKVAEFTGTFGNPAARLVQVVPPFVVLNTLFAAT